jgi:hypothetical protein
MANQYTGDYLYPEDDPSYTPSQEPTQPTEGPQDYSGYQGDYLYPEDDPSFTPPVQPQPQQQRQPFQPQESPQLFPEGQDHVAREVLGLKPKPFQRSEILPESHFGILGDIGSGIADSFLRTGEMALQAVRAYDEPGVGTDALRDIATKGIEKIRAWEDEYPRIFKPSEETQDSYFRRSVHSALVNFMPSAFSGLVGGAAGAAVGAIGGPVGAIGGFVVGFGAGAGLLFGSSEYDSFMEEADANGIPREQVFGEAMTSAFVEGGGEMVADIAALAIFGPTGGLSLASKGALKQMMKVPIRNLMKNYLKVAPVEVITEMIQGSSQVALRNKAGMDAGTPWHAAVEAIGPALIMTALFGAAGGAKQSLHLRQMRKALEDGNVDPAKRQSAADFVENSIKDKDFAELWKFNAKQFIDAGYDIPLDREMSEYLAWGETSEWSPQLAEDLMAGKDIKLLPAPERGFILVGEPYNPDDRADYDTYSPEFAKKIKEHTETLALPPGQDFTMEGKTYTAYSPTLREAKVKKEAAKAPKQITMPPVEFESELTEEGELVRAERERQLEPLQLPPGQGFRMEDLTPEEAAARGVEAAIETGRPEDIAQAQRRVERAAEVPPALADRVPALVRRTLKEKPGATIGEVYRSVKAKDKTANRQDVAKMVRQERKVDFPTTKKGLKAELDAMGKDDFNHFYNPVNLESRLMQAMTESGISREDAKAEIRPALADYAKNYEAVNKEALAEIAKAKKPKVTQAKRKLPKARTKEQIEEAKRKVIEELEDDKAEKAKEAAEAPKKLKAKPKPKKKKLVAKQPKKAVKPTKKKPSAAVTLAAMEKPKVEKKAEIKPKRKITKAVLTKKETERLAKEAEARLKAKEEEEITPSALRIGVTIDTPDGKGTILHSPQEGQWAVRIDDKKSWAYGDTLIYGSDELAPKKKLEAKKDVKARLGKAPEVIVKEWRKTKIGDEVEVQYDIKRGDQELGRIDLAMDLTQDEVYIDWMEFDTDTTTGKQFKLTLTEIRGLHRQLKKLWPHVKYIHAIRAHDPRARGITLRAKIGKPAFSEAKAGDFVAARDRNKRLGFLSQTPAEDLKDHKLFVSADGHSGYAIAPDGDLQMVFSNVEAPRGQGAEAVRHAIANGATKLDAFAGWLPNYYKQFGFEETSRIKWDDQYAPVGWNYAQYGRPDVVFMALKGEKADSNVRGRSSASIARQAAAQREQGYIHIIRQAFPTATAIKSAKFLHDVFDVTLPNGSEIQVKMSAMPEDIDIAALQKNYARDITGEVPLGLWVPGPNVTITGEGTIWLAGFGELQRDIDHETWHAAKSIVLNNTDEAQLRKDYPGTAQTQDEREAEAYDEWSATERSHKIFDKIRSFFRSITEQYGIGKGKSYRIFRTVINGKVWSRPIGKVSTRGRVYDSIASLRKEIPRFKGKALRTVRTMREDIFNDRDHWETVGAVLYIEGLSGRAWTEEMQKQLLEHYGIAKVPANVMSTIRKDSQHIFDKRTAETLSGKLPTMEALMQMEQRGAAEGGIVWYDEQDGLSTIAIGEDGEYVARSALSELQEYFGEDAELMAGLIAHLSSGLQVPLNTTKAIEVYIAYKLDIGFKGTYQVTRESIDKFLETRKTTGPKRSPFLDAILGDADAIVIDRWMARVLDFRTKNVKTGEWQTATGASDKQRELLIAWVERGAKRLGISNRAYQAMIWAGKKAIDEETSGRPTGSLKPLADVIEQKVKLKAILARDIPKGKEEEYFILKGMDRWAIHKESFMPLADMELFEKLFISRKPKEIDVPRLPVEQLTAEEQASIEKQQGQLFARMSKQTIVEDSLDDMFGGKQKGLLRKMKDGILRFKEFRTLVLDEFHPILKHLGDRVYKLHRMLNGVHASIEALMRHGKLKLDDDGNIVADGRDRGFAVWARKHGKDAVNVLRWAAAKRSEQLEKDNPEWLKNEEFLTEAKRERIYNEIGAAPEGGGTWESLHAEFDEFHQSILDIAEKAGLIDEVVREDWRDLIYVPFYRVFEDTATREEFLANPKKAKDIAAKVKPIKGSKRKIGEPIENVIANWGYMIQESMRNQARAEAYVSAKMLNEVSDLMRDIDYQEIKHTIINDKGVITYETERGDDMVLSFLENGKRKYFAVHDADLYYALTTMNAQHFGKLFNAFFGGPKRLLTYGATFGPAFRVANAVRDTLHTWMITPGMSFTPFLSTFKGFISSMREDEHYVAALAAGGLHGGSYVHAEDPTSMSKFTKRLLGKQGKAENIIDTLGKALDMWDRIGAASENAARVQLHRQLLEKGETGLEAAYQARDLLDFSLKGQSKVVLALIRTIPFLGARTQGNYRLARAAIDPKTRYSMAIKGSILAAASLALWSFYKDDDRYKELEDYDKWTYYHWWIGEEHYRMPKPFEVGAIFSSMFESIANTMHGNEEMEFMARFFKHTFTETFAIGVPQTVKPLAELWANKSFFTGRPIEGKAMKLLAPGERAEPWTPETLQLLGRGLNISPKKMEALMRGYLATISTFMLGATDQIARWVGDFPERPSYRSDDYPLIGRFWKQGPARNTKYATRIYELMEESDRLVQTVRHYMIEGDLERAEKLADSNLGLFSANKFLNRTRKKMSQLRRVMKDVERSRTLSREEKRKELDELTVLRNGYVKEVYEVLGAEMK